MLPIAVGGLIAWGVVGLILLAIRPTLAAHGHTNWLWICLAGFGLSILGVLLMRAHDARRRTRLAQSSPPPSGGAGNASTSPSS
jgi:bacteriorhodopsin